MDLMPEIPHDTEACWSKLAHLQQKLLDLQRDDVPSATQLKVSTEHNLACDTVCEWLSPIDSSAPPPYTLVRIHGSSVSTAPPRPADKSSTMVIKRGTRDNGPQQPSQSKLERYMDYLVPWEPTQRVEPPTARGPPLQRREVYAPGELAGAPVEALPDTGADECFISSDFVSLLKLEPLPRTKTKTLLATGRSIKSPGIVKVPWRFAGEAKTHLLHCRILPGCIHPLILGRAFLQATKTLTEFKRRIKTRLCSLRSKLRLRFLGGGEGQRLHGYFDDQPIAALPDTGSDLMLVSGSFARRQGLRVDRSNQNRLELELADGSTEWTSGVVKDVEWRVGSEARHCDFYVLEDLDTDVVLSSTYVFEMDVFSRFTDCLVDKEYHYAEPGLFNIRLIGRYGDRLCELEAESAFDMTAPDAFGPLKVERELARRDRIRDEISGIPDLQTRDAAAAAERMRQQHWEAARRLHRLLSSSREAAPAAPDDGGANRARGALVHVGSSSEGGREDLRRSRKPGHRRRWRGRMAALVSSFADRITVRREDDMATGQQ